MILIGLLFISFYSTSMIQLGDKYHYCEVKNFEEKYCENLKKVEEFKESIHHE